MTDIRGRAQIDFDHHGHAFAENGLEIEAEMRRSCPVGWSPLYGGFWAVSPYSGVSTCLREKDVFSSAKEVDASGNATGGTVIPAISAYKAIPLESDPPEWGKYRRVLDPFFSPRAMAKVRTLAEAYSTEVINRVIEAGEADFIRDIACPVTALIMLDLVGLPIADYEFYGATFHRFPYDPTSSETRSALMELDKRLLDEVRKHRASPGAKIIDGLVTARIDGAPLADQIVVNMVWLLLGAGFDTTATLLSGAVLYLSERRQDHARLISDERLMKTATEEFCRWVSPLVANARTARRSFTVGDQEIQAGERLYVMFRSANHDSALFDDPETVNLARYPNRHFGFGAGIHRCLGSNLARMVFQVVLRDVLARMPDFIADPDWARPLPDRGMVNGWISMPIRFTPGKREDPAVAVRPA
jgi:cytochrome P450